MPHDSGTGSLAIAAVGELNVNGLRPLELLRHFILRAIEYAVRAEHDAFISNGTKLGELRVEGAFRVRLVALGRLQPERRAIRRQPGLDEIDAVETETRAHGHGFAIGAN